MPMFHVRRQSMALLQNCDETHGDGEENVLRTKRQRTDAPLYSNTTMTSFLVCVSTLTMYNSHPGLSQQCVTEILMLIKRVLGTLVTPEDMPETFQELQRVLNPYMITEQLMTSCPGECDIFTGPEHKCATEKCRTKKGKKYHYTFL